MAQISKGGLKAPDMVTQNLVWKHSWLQRLQETQAIKWCYLIKKKMKSVGGLEYFLKCNYKYKNTDLKLSEFWEEVLTAHEKISNQYVIGNRMQVKAQIINNNQYVRIQDRSIYNPRLLENDMDLVENWFHWTGHLKRFEEVKAKCSINWLEYAQIRSAMPKPWKDIMKDRTIEAYGHVPVHNNKQEIKIKLNLARAEILPTHLKWNLAVKEIGGVELNWPMQFKLIYKVSKEVKLQYFQYKLLADIIVTGKKLKMYGMRGTDECGFCKQGISTVRHMYVECTEDH